METETIQAGFSISIDNETTTVRTWRDLAVVLDVLQGHHDREVLQQLSIHLPEVVSDSIGLYSTLKVLAPDDQLFLIKALGQNLLKTVEKAAALRDILAFLSDDTVEMEIVKNLGTTGLQSLIQTPLEMAEILEWIYGDSEMTVLELLGREYVTSLFTTGEEVSLVLLSLQENKAALLDIIGWEHIVRLIRNGRDLACMLRALPEDISKQLLEYYTGDQLRKLIRNKTDWEYLWNRLETKEADCILKLLEVK